MCDMVLGMMSTVLKVRLAYIGVVLVVVFTPITYMFAERGVTFSSEER